MGLDLAYAYAGTALAAPAGKNKALIVFAFEDAVTGAFRPT
ncbi:MAG: hypothetical protein ACRETN_05120 [Nevskiales bacterium]